MTPSVCVITVAYNEEWMLPCFLEHYSKIASKIHIIDGGSTDSSSEIVKKYGDLVTLDVRPSDKLDDLELLSIRNTTAASLPGYDWYVVVDVDELIFGPVLEFLSTCKEDVVRMLPFHMVGDPDVVHSTFRPEDEHRGILDWRWGDKSALFRSGVKPNYEIGCHKANPKRGFASASVNCERVLEFRHYQMSDLTQYLKKSKIAAERLSETNKRNGWGINRQRACESEFRRYWSFPDAETFINGSRVV